MHVDKKPPENNAFDRALSHYMDTLESFEAKALINEFAEQLRTLLSDMEIRHAYLEHRIAVEDACIEDRDRDLLVAMLVGMKHYKQLEIKKVLAASPL